MHIAVGLLDGGWDVTYATSSSWARDSLLLRASRFPIIESSWLSRNLKRRELPSGIRAANVLHAAVLHEVGFQLSLRFGKKDRTDVLRRRVAKFESAIARFAASQEVEAVYCQYMGAEEIFAAVGGQAPRILGYPTAHHHWAKKHLGDEALSNPDWAPFLQDHDFDPEYAAKLDREIEMADLILVPSTFVRQTFIDESVPDIKIRVLPLGADIPDFTWQKTYATQVGMPENPLRVLFAGRVTQQKGISYALEAVAQVTNAHLTIVGNPMPGMTEKIGSAPRVTMSPSQPRPTLMAVMAESDVLVLPSLADGFGLVAIEAMSTGTPCIVSTCTFADDVIDSGVNGIVVDVRNTQQIADALQSLIDDPSALRRLGLAASATARLYTWARYERDVTIAIEGAVENYSGSRARSSF